MKDLKKISIPRPALNIGILMIGLALLLTPTTTLANGIDEELLLESWMTVPFDNEIQESDLHMEFWMAIPFDNELQESDLNMESWMLVPFENELQESDLNFESWMTSDWI